MFCTSCGTEVTEANSKFCSECGASLAPDEGVAPAQGQVPVSAPQAASSSPSAQAASSAPAPAPSNSVIPPQGQVTPAKSASNKKLIAIIAAAAVVIIGAAIAFFVINSGPNDGLTPEERRGFFTGTWVATDSNDEKRPEAWFKGMAGEGAYFTLTLWDDGTGVYRTVDGPTKIEWEAESTTSATTSIDDEKTTITLRSKKLTLTDSEGVETYFVPGDEVDMSNAIDLSQSGFGVTVDPSTIKVGDYLKLIGNESVGYMQVPESWVNRINDLDSAEVKRYDTVYYVDPRTEFTSSSTGSPDFALKVEMTRQSDSYRDVAQELYDSFSSDSNYGIPTKYGTTIGKRRAIIIESTNKADNVNVLRVVIDRDNDDKVAVVLAFNGSTISNDKGLGWVLAYSQSWQVE